MKGYAMSDISKKFVVVTITQQEALVWATGMDLSSFPEQIHAFSGISSLHLREDPSNKGPGGGPVIPIYFEEIVKAIGAPSEILILGHGNGKARGMVHFLMYLERMHPELAKKVVAALDTNIYGMTHLEILTMAHDWFNSHPQSRFLVHS